MFWSLHATKGGIGTSVVTASLALELGEREQKVVLVDFCGDQPDILGVEVGDRHGVVDWLTSAEPVDAAALDGLLVPVSAGLSLLPAGRSELTNGVGSLDPGRIAELVTGLAKSSLAIGDLGVIGNEPTLPRAQIGAASDRRTLLIRPCYLALRRATRVPISFDSLVEVYEDGRALRTLDVEAVMGMAVSARVRVDPAIARAVDSGTLVSRRPRALRRFIGDLLAEHEVPEAVRREGLISRESVQSW